MDTIDAMDDQTAELDAKEQQVVTQPVELPAAPPATKYHEIALLASRYAEDFLTNKHSCDVMAHDFLAAAREYFGAPGESFKLVRLLTDLRRDTSPEALYDLTQGRDGFWYCGMAMMFESAERGFSEVCFPIGFQSVGEQSTFRLKGDHSIDMAASDRWANTMAQIDAELHNYYLRPAFEFRAPLGFVP